MPIPNVGVASTAKTAEPPSTIKSVTGLSGDEVSRLFGTLPFNAFKSAGSAAPGQGDVRSKPQ